MAKKKKASKKKVSKKPTSPPEKKPAPPATVIEAATVEVESTLELLSKETRAIADMMISRPRYRRALEGKGTARSIRAAFTDLTPKSLGLPVLPQGCMADEGFSDKSIVRSWVKGIKPNTDLVDWWFMGRDRSMWNSYTEAGGSFNKAVIHNLNYDTKIEPLWDHDYLLTWIEEMRERGIQHIVAPDFSSWTNWPYVTQLYNFYRSMAVTCDYAFCGMKIIANPRGGAPALHHIGYGAWPVDCPVAVVDMQHMKGKTQVESIRNPVYDSYAQMLETINIRVPLCYGRPKWHKEYRERFDKGVWAQPWIMARNTVADLITGPAKRKRRKLDKAIRQRTRDKTKAAKLGGGGSAG